MICEMMDDAPLKTMLHKVGDGLAKALKKKGG